MYLCKCDCGTIKTVLGKCLRTGHTLSCGCLGYEHRRIGLTKHGYSFSRTYIIWAHIKSRCNDSNCKSYEHYGGRGISVCERWSKFENFLADMGHRPNGKTIDRIDVNGNYEPSNCRWATWKEQANNTRKNVRLTYLGRTQTISQWADELGIPRTAIRTRYYKGQSIDQILAVPKLEPELIIFMGKKRTYPEIAALVGIPYVTLRWRIRKGIPLKKAVVPPTK